jgi:ABC-type molybdate transport system ATPase subunit
MATTLNRADAATVENASQTTGLQVRVRRTLTSEDGGFQLDVDFELQNGITILFGPSGAGKTTLLDCIAGLTDLNEGRIVVGARVLIDSQAGTSSRIWRCFLI